MEYATHWTGDYDAKVFFPDFSAAFRKLLSLGASKLQSELQLLGERMTYHALKDCSAVNKCATDADCPNQFFPKCDTSVTPSQCRALTCPDSSECPHPKAARCDLALLQHTCQPCDHNDQCKGGKCAFGECVASVANTTKGAVTATTKTSLRTSSNINAAAESSSTNG